MEKILHTIKLNRANRNGHILRQDCLLKQANEEKTDVKRRRGRTRKQLLADFNEKRRYWNLKNEALDCNLLFLPLALQPIVGFGLSNNVLPFFPICHQLSHLLTPST